MIEKPAILVTSIGRTGTEFFAKFFDDVIPGSTSLHEPDIVQFVSKNRLASLVSQVRRAGVWRMVILKALGKWSLVALSDSRLEGRLDDRRAAEALHGQRAGFISRMPGRVYVESNFGYYGLLDVLPGAFANHRAICLVRDGRNWVRSGHNWGEAYGKKGLRKLVGHKWPEATDIPRDPLADSWADLPRFDRLCWAWARLNEFAVEGISRNPHARLFRFEDIFIGEDRYRNLDDLVGFATSLSGFNASCLRSTRGWLERKIHPSSDSFPAWEDWTVGQKSRFEQICGPLMQKLGYRL